MKKNTKWIIAGIVVLIVGCSITDYRFEIDYKINNEKKQWKEVSAKYAKNDTLNVRSDTLTTISDTLCQKPK